MSTAGAVLVVDDDELVREVVGRYLGQAGYQVTAAADGGDALLTVRAAVPDLVVLDLMLPGLSGLEVCRLLRAQRPVPIVMLTALGEEEDRIAGPAARRGRLHHKPFSPRELALRVASVLRRARSAQTGDRAARHDGGLRCDVAPARGRAGDGAEWR